MSRLKQNVQVMLFAVVLAAASAVPAQGARAPVQGRKPEVQGVVETRSALQVVVQWVRAFSRYAMAAN